MIVFSDLQQYKEATDGCAVALGNFDGVHKGHQLLIRSCVEAAEQEGIPSAVFTFRDHPTNVMMGHSVVKCLMTLDQKVSAVEALGVDYLVVVPFTDEMRNCSPENFVKDILVDQLHCRHAFCGFNYSFGHKALGTPKMLRDFGAEYGFSVTEMPEFDLDGGVVSSTRLRRILEQGDMEAYTSLAGRAYAISGKVVRGEQNGRKMGFPTANLNIPEGYAVPPRGVYVTRTTIDGAVYASVTNVGTKPTIGLFTENAETHVLDYSGELYDNFITVEFVHMIRPERQFESMDALAEQIRSDCSVARNFASRPSLTSFENTEKSR